jgi:PAS domain S-box-containing protein
MLVRPFESHALKQLSEDVPPVADLLTLATLMTDQPNPTVIDVNPTRQTGASGIAHEALRAAGIEIVVTLGRRGQLLGAILLGPRRSGEAYFKNDLAFIESLAELASIALENALLYRQRIQMLEYSDRLLESLNSAVVAIDLTGKITSFNPAAKDLLGLEQHKRGASLDVLPSEIAWALAMAITRSWHPREVEVTIDHKSRRVIHVILSTDVLHDDENKVAGAFVVVTDLSAVKALERNQRRVEHFAIMARFYAGIAHEIRNPLAAISNFISMLPDRFDDPEYRDTAVRLLPLEVSRIVRLSDRLRLMAPSEDGNLNLVSLPPLLNDIVAIHSPAAQEQRVKISLNCSEEIPRILGDPSQLVQLFVNLLRNAVEAMPDGGTVTIEAEHLAGRTGPDSVIVRVIDEGPGIDPVIRPKIFEPFFTTKPSGTGLGLSICREIADFHRARLTLLPRTFGGTEAEVEFPHPPPESSTR